MLFKLHLVLHFDRQWRVWTKCNFENKDVTKYNLVRRKKQVANELSSNYQATINQNMVFIMLIINSMKDFVRVISVN